MTILRYITIPRAVISRPCEASLPPLDGVKMNKLVKSRGQCILYNNERRRKLLLYFSYRERSRKKYSTSVTLKVELELTLGGTESGPLCSSSLEFYRMRPLSHEKIRMRPKMVCSNYMRRNYRTRSDSSRMRRMKQCCHITKCTNHIPEAVIHQ